MRISTGLASTFGIEVAPGTPIVGTVPPERWEELARFAKEKLGAKFALKEFHDVVLGSGPLPLDILARNVDEWIAAQARPAVDRAAASGRTRAADSLKPGAAKK